MTKQEMQETLAYAQLGELLEAWEMADKLSGEAIGLLLEELESRNPVAFKKWLEQDKQEKTLSEFMTEGN